jgi:HSP20 family molecular chaperone IbpA
MRINAALWPGADDCTVKADLPDAAQQDILVSVEDDVVTIGAGAKREHEES